jgi:adenylate cyclase
LNPEAKPWLRLNLPVAIAAGVIAAICFLQALPHLFPSINIFERLEWMSYDWRVRGAFYQAQTAPAANLGVVFIDDESLREVNRNYGYAWPWPRQLYGRVASELAAQGAKVVGFDILFIDRHPLTAETALLINDEVVSSDDFFGLRLREANNVVLAGVGEHTSEGWKMLLPPPVFHTNASQIGHITSDADADGVLRRVRAFVDDPVLGRFWHLGLVLAARELHLDLDSAVVEPTQIHLRGPAGNERVIPVDAHGFFYIDWSLSWNDPRLAKADFQDVLLDELGRANGRTNGIPTWRDKVVVVGSIGSGNNIRDFGATPLSRQTYLLSKHWNVANSILLNRFIQRSSYLTEMMLILLLGATAAVITWRLRALAATALVLVVLGLYVWLGVQLFHQSRYWLPMVLPGLGALLMTHVCMVTYRVVFEQKERHRIRNVFAKVVSSNVVSELLRAEKVSLGGARRKVTVYFADIRGFTEVTDEHQARAEEYVARHRLSPTAAEAYLNERASDVLGTVSLYLGVVADTIKQHNGTLDKFIGDCVMAFWGAPTPRERQSVECVQAAIDAQRAVHQLNLQRAQENERRKRDNDARTATGLPPLPPLMLLDLGSGINTGMATVGLMGSDAHLLNYTVFGREVNLASRLEGLSGHGRVIISESTYRELQRLAPDLAAICVQEPAVSVKGIREHIQPYRVRWRDTMDVQAPNEKQSISDPQLASETASAPTAAPVRPDVR